MKELDIGNGTQATVIEIFSPLFWHVDRWLHYERKWNGIDLWQDALNRYYILIDPRDSRNGQ